MSKTKSKISKFSEKIKKASENEVIEETLKTSERVLKRITDGIYRQPSSAIRELISNSYDADATIVEIQTDPPRFESILVRDNGNGLSEDSLSHLIHSIGGSPKRTASGVELGICNPDDATQSPGGRKLIGKIGIGLFSVSQLTKEFQIITKKKGWNHRIVADIVLRTNSEEQMIDPDSEFETGSVRIWKVSATDTDSHGTEINLRNLLQKTRDDLSSKEMWSRCNPGSVMQIGGESVKPQEPPSYHIGCIHEDSPQEIGTEPKLPWEQNDPETVRFNKLVQAMVDERQKISRPSLGKSFDYYLNMIWTLSLSAPLDYVDIHPFELTASDNIKIFRFGNELSSSAKEVKLNPMQTIRQAMDLVSPERGGNKDFKVMIDGIQLFRPIRLRDLPVTDPNIEYPLLFIGKDAPDLSEIAEEIRGGNLEFESYFLWNHSIVPQEHSGVLVRINDSSGVLFDQNFMNYPVAELTRKKQVTAEIFVTRGLDAALNIDRESFNYAHPHYQYIANWVHNAFRQFATRQKSLSSEIREKKRKTEAKQQQTQLESIVEQRIQTIVADEDSIPAPVEFVDDEDKGIGKQEEGVISFKKSEVFQDRKPPSKMTSQERKKEALFEAK